ncbi:unnamed protein product, partial [Staurois parvus]
MSVCQCVLWSEYGAAGPVFPPRPCQNTGPAAQLCSGTLPVPLTSGALSSPGFCSVGVGHDSRVPSAHAQEAVLFV